MAGTTAEQVKNQADKLESDIREEHRDAAQDALTDSENLAELQRIKQQADLDERVPQRDRPGFFERILSFFSFNSKYKSGEMSRGKNKKRSGKSYEDFLIAKLSYQASGNSAYEDAGDGLTFSRYTEGAEKSFSNDSAAINQTRTEEGQSVNASTNVTYFDRVRLINADANFKHRILGDSTAAYTSERVQLRLLGEFRDLKLNDGSMTLLHNYTAGTDKFGAIASADFSDARSGVDVSTGAFFMRDGNAAPKIIFKDGSITLSTKDFTVKMNAPSSTDGKTIISDKNLLSITKLRQTTEINSEICLTDRGIIPPETHPKDGSPVLTSDENGRLCAGVVVDGENGEEIVEIGKPAETPEDENANGNEPDSEDAGITMKLGPVTFTGVKRSVDLENGLNVKFSANGATIDNVDFLELGRTKAALQLSGSQPNKAVLESTALIFKGLDFLSSVELSGSEIAVDKDGVSFKEISLGARDFDIGFLKAENAAVKLTKEESIAVSAEANNISIEANLGGLELSAEKLSGKLEFPEGSPALNITDGSVSAGSDVLRLTLANLKYSDGTLDFGSAKAETKNIKLFGLAELSDISAETTAGSITRNGLKIGNDMSLKLSAGFSLLERKLGGLEFELDNSGFRGTFEFEKNAELISTDPFSLSASGKLGFKHEHDSGKTTPQTNGFGAKAKLFGMMELSADDIGIDSENKQFTASEMYGGIDNILSVTGKDVKLGKDGAGFSELTAEYSGFELFGGLLSVDDGQFTAKSPEKFEGVISAGFSAGEVSASVSAALEFTREKNYLPAITGIDEFSLGIGDSRLEGAKLSGVQDSGEKALDFSAKKLSIGKNEKVCISGITGSASRDKFALSSADVIINDLFGTGTLTGKIINMTADSSGLYFDKISFGSQKISLGESLSADSAEISMSKTKQDGFSVTAHAENIESQMNFTPFSLKTSKLSGDVTYKNGTVSVGTSGDITLGLAELLSLTLTDLEYGDKVLSFSSIKAELLKEELFGGAVKFSGLTASAEKVGFSADGISTEDGSGITITADNISLLKASFGDLSAEVTPEGFTAEADAALGSTEHTIIPNVAAAVMGKLSLNYSRDDKLNVGMNNISAFISVFDNRLSAENITAAGDSLNIETISGEFPLPGFGKDTSVSMTGKNISIGKGFRMDSLEAETNGALTFFNDMLSISGIKFEAANNFSSFTVKGSVGISAGGVSASAGGTVSVRKVNDEWSTKLKSLNDIALKVKRIGSITASSIAQDEENEKQLNITGITVRAYDPEGENATFLESIAGKNQIGVKLGLMKYYDGELHPDMSTLDFESKQIKVNIADKIGGTLDFGERSLAIEYSITLPKDYDEKETASFPELISASVYAPILPGVFVKGSAFAGAGMSSRMSLKAMFGSLSENSADSPDGVRDKGGTTTFDLTGTAALSAKAGGGVKAALVLGIPGLAQVEAGIRGTIEGSVNNSALTGNIGINYDKGQKKFSIAKDGRTGASVKFNAGLKAKLSAFVGGKLFAVIGKDLLSFNICQINLADVDFSGSAKYTPDGWKFSTEGLKMSSDLADLFKNRGITVDTTKKNLRMGELNSLLGDIQENCAPLLGGRLGTEEAMESAAKYQAEIFPALEELRSLADSSFEALAKADRQYYTEKNHSWEDADARELSAEDADATIAELQGGSTNLRALAKEILDDRIKFRNRESTIMPDKDTGIVDTAAIRDHLNGRPGFRSPAAILAALSKDNYFNTSDKNAWIEDKMKRYINVRVAINSVYRNPVEKGAGTAALTTYNITLDSLKNTTQSQKNGITSSMQEYKQTISETISDYNSLDKLNRELMELMGEMDEETRKLREKAKAKEPGSSKKLEELAAKKETLTKDISDLRATISKTSGLKRQNAIDTIYGLNESLKSSRSQLSEARDIYAHKDAKKGGSLLDISEFVNDDTSPYTDQRYNISRLKPFLGAKYVVGEQQEFVSKNEFRRAAWTALLHNADENENDLALFVKSVIKFKAGEVHGTVSNQMLKTMYSNQAYAKVTNTEISDESHNVDLAKLRAANKEQVEQMREEAGKQEDKMSAIEKLVYESNDSYIRAERLYLRLMDIQPGNFENELSTTDDNAAAYVRQAAGYSNAINTLKDNIELTMAGGPLSREHINQLKSSANQA